MAAHTGPSPSPPNRRWTFTLELGGDERQDIIRALYAIGHHLEQGEGQATSTCGGPTSGWHYTLDEDPEMDHDTYFERVSEYLAACRQSDGDEGNDDA